MKVKKVEKISTYPLKFGSREDFRKALTELRYFEKIHGSLKGDYLNQVAQKYQFPNEFLKQGLKGLSFPDDYMISKSKWFPILYRWAVDEENYSRKLLILFTRYIRGTFSPILVLSVTVLMVLQIAFYAYHFVRQTPVEIFSWLGLSTAFLVLGLVLEFHKRISEKRKDLEEHIEIMNKEHMGKSVRNMMNFVNKNYRTVLFAGYDLASKPAAPSFFYAGEVEVRMKKEPRIGRLQRILTTLRSLPKPESAQSTKETIPVFYAENPHLAYLRRLSKLFELEDKET